jgi:hypothetical protein
MKLNQRERAKVISTFFTTAEVNRVAYQTNFVQRTHSKLSGSIFLQAFVFACLEHSRVSLNKIAQSCLDLGVEITAQGIDQRLSQASVAFMQQMFVKAMATFVNELALPLPVLVQFSGVNLIDSSIIPLADELAETYPGSGGNASSASLKLQVVFDFLYNNLRQFILAPGRQADKGFSDYLAVVQPGSLNIGDLGYFNLDNFRQIDQLSAYFLSRYQSRTAVLCPDGTVIDLLHELSSHPQAVVERSILLGKAQHLSCRLIAFRLKQEVAEQRRRKAKKAAKRRGKSIRPATLALLDWSIYVTNVPDTMLNAAQVAVIYRVRWQIELVFKLCKSYCGLRSFAHLRMDRLLTELYTRMMGLLLIYFLMAPLRMPAGPQANREVSPVQVRLICQRFARHLSQVVTDIDQLTGSLSQLNTHILRFGFKQKRKKKPNVCHSLALVSSVFQLPFSLNQEIDLLACPSF